MAREAAHPRDPELAQLARAAGERARLAARFAVEAAFQAAPVRDEVVAEALDALARLDMAKANKLRERLQTLVEALEEPYWAASNTVDSADSPERVTTFSRARAVNALECALAADPADAAVGAIYEAQAALPDEQAGQLVQGAKAILRMEPPKR